MSGLLVAGAWLATALVIAVGHVPRDGLTGNALGTVEPIVAGGKVLVGLAVLAVLFAERRSPKTREHRATTTAFVVALGAVAYMNFGVASGWSRFYNTWDDYHYYVGSKYARELGYTHLYRCSVIAEAESSPMRGNSLGALSIRDLETGGVVPASSVMANTEECKSRFSAARWRAFSDDVVFFRSRCRPKLWAAMLMDHGYQPPPAWTFIGGGLARLVPASDAGLWALAALDLALIAGCFGLVYWAFDRRALLVAVTFFGCQWPANAFFMAGTHLRHEWLFGCVAALCLAARRRWFGSGTALGIAIATRLFPIVLGAGWIVASVVRPRRSASSSTSRRFTLGAAGALTVALTLGVAGAGCDAYSGFGKSIALHARTPLVEQMGLATIVSFVQDDTVARTQDVFSADQFAEWRTGRIDALRDHVWILVAVAAASMALFGVAMARTRAAWAALAFGVVLVVTLTNIAAYYYSVFLLLAPLGRASRLYGNLLVVTAVLSSGVVCVHALSTPWDHRYFLESILFLVAACGFLVVRASSRVARARRMKAA